MILYYDGPNVNFVNSIIEYDLIKKVPPQYTLNLLTTDKQKEKEKEKIINEEKIETSENLQINSNVNNIQRELINLLSYDFDPILPGSDKNEKNEGENENELNDLIIDSEQDISNNNSNPRFINNSLFNSRINNLHNINNPMNISARINSNLNNNLNDKMGANMGVNIGSNIKNSINNEMNNPMNYNFISQISNNSINPYLNYMNNSIPININNPINNFNKSPINMKDLNSNFNRSSNIYDTIAYNKNFFNNNLNNFSQNNSEENSKNIPYIIKNNTENKQKNIINYYDDNILNNNINNVNNVLANNFQNMPNIKSINNSDIRSDFKNRNIINNINYINNIRNFNNINNMGNINNISNNNNIKFNYLKENKYSNMSILEITNKLDIIAKKQPGCRFLENLIKTNENSYEMINKIFFPKLYWAKLFELCNDLFGNYFIQTIIPELDSYNLISFTNLINNNLLKLCLNPHGTRVVQVLIDNIKDNKFNLLLLFTSYLSKIMDKLINDLNGSFVLMHYAKVIKSNEMIFNFLNKNIIEISTKPYSCSALQKFIDIGTNIQRNKLLNNIIINTRNLIGNQCGLYVLQFVMDKKNYQINDIILEKIINNIIRFSKQKYSSNVIEKCLETCSPEAVNKMIDILNKEEVIRDLIKDMFGNYVIQKLLIVCPDDKIRKHILDIIASEYNSLINLPFGYKLIKKLTVNYPEIKNKI